MPRKMAQSAMEFLMTYGWALLIIVIIIAVLFYLGILQPKTPNSLIFSPGFSASSFRVGSGTGAFELDFGHAKGQTIRVTKAGCSMQEIPALTQSLTNLTNPVVIPSGTHKWIIGGDSGNTLNCLDENGNPLNPSNAEVGQRYRGKVCIEYEEVESGLTRQVCGDLNARFESGVSGATPTPTPSPITGCGTINSPGYYVLQNNLSASGTCITITSGGSNSTLDCNGKTITGSGSGYGIYLTSATGVTIKNCVVKNFGDDAIQLYDSSNNIITNNNVTLSGSGIRITHFSNNNTITGNNATNNTGYYGILIEYYSNNNVVAGNNASSNNWDGIRLYLYACNNNIANNIVVSNNHLGISLFSGSSNNTITGNTASSNGWSGIYLESSSNNIITGNTVSSNGGNGNQANLYGWNGIYIKSYSTNNIITGNNASSNGWNGIRIDYSDNNNITGNTVSSNNQTGIYLYISSNIVFDDNTACDNNQSGGGYYDLYCCSSSTSSGDSIFDTNSGCTVTQTSTCS